MRRLFVTIIMSYLVQAILFAQSTTDPSQQFLELKKGFAEASTNKQMKEAAKLLDAFLSHVNIGKSDSDSHNKIPFLTCRYEHTPLTTSAILRQGTTVDTIQFQEGRWYVAKDLSPDMKLDLVCLESVVGHKRKSFQKTTGAMIKKHTHLLGEELADKRGTAFFVKEEGLYYAAIGSKKIPPFPILSNSAVVNYASCLKVILKASCVESTYDEIIGKYLSTTIDEKFVPLKNCNKMISDHKVVTTFVPLSKVRAADIVNELLRERFMIAVDKDGSPALLTAIALTGEHNYQPVHVRMRLPLLSKDEQRVQMTWRDFCNHFNQLARVSIY